MCYDPETIRAARRRHGLTQAKFAKALGLSLRQYQRLENGEQEPTRTVLRLIDLLETRMK